MGVAFPHWEKRPEKFVFRFIIGYSKKNFKIYLHSSKRGELFLVIVSTFCLQIRLHNFLTLKTGDLFKSSAYNFRHNQLERYIISHLKIHKLLSTMHNLCNITR